MPAQGNFGPLGTSIESGEIEDNAVTDAKIATQVSTKITGLPQQTQDLDMGEKDINNVEGVTTVATSPTVAGSLLDVANMANPNSVYVVGDYAYVVSPSDGLVIIDISDPTTPVRVGTFTEGTILTNPVSIFVSNHIAYIADSTFDGLVIVDVTTASDPTILGNVSSDTRMDGASSVYISGMHAYITGETSGSLAIIDITNPNHPKLVGSVIDPTNMNGAVDVHVSGMHAHVISNLSNSLVTIDISDSSNPILLETLVDANFAGATDIYVSGNIAYITGSTNSVLVTVDITDVTSPSTLGSLIDATNMGGASGVFVVGDHAYVTGSTTDSFAIIDISAPSAPLLVDSLFDSTNLNGAISIFIKGTIAYVTAKDGSRLTSVDIKGIDAHVARIGSAEITHLSVTDNAVVANNMYVGGLNVGVSGIHSKGDTSITGKLSTGGTSDAKLTSISVEEQLRLGFDDTNYTSFTTDVSDINGASYDDVLFSVTSEDVTPTGMHFNTNGTKMYVLGANTETVYQYSLSTGFDISTASYDSVFLDVSTEDISPNDVDFNNDGTKMYIVGNNNDTIFQYTLTTAFDLSTASYATIFFSLSTQELQPTGMAFNLDGSKMFVIGTASLAVFEYDLGTFFNVSTAVYNSASFPFSEDVSPQGLLFNSDGTRMYIVGASNDEIYQYTLTTGFDISTASYDSIFLDVSPEEGGGSHITFNSDFTKLYLTGSISDGIHQYTMGTDGLTITPTAGEMRLASKVGVGISNPDSIDAKLHVLETTEQLRLGFDSTNYASFTVNNNFKYSNTFATTSVEDTTPQGVAFNSDKSKMFVLGGDNLKVFQYTLSTPGDPSTATYDSLFVDLSSEFTIVKGLTFNIAGDRMYVCEASNVRQYNLATGFDFSDTVTFSTNVLSTIPEGSTFNTGLAFNGDDTELFVLSNSGQGTLQYSFSTVDDLSTVSYSGNSSNIFDSVIAFQDIAFNDDGSVMYLANTTDNVIVQVTLTDYNLSTTVDSENNIVISSEISSALGIYYDDGLYAVNGALGNVYLYDINNNLTIAPTSGKTILVGDLTVDSGAILQTPAMPSFVGTVVDAVNLIQANTVYVVGKYAYVTAGSTSDTLNIIDISEPTAPVIISSFTDALLDGANDVVVSGDYAYVTGGASTSLVIVDVSNPTTPTLKGSVVEATDLNGARHIYLSGKYAYITAATNNSLTIVDISDPTAPFVTGVFTDALLDAPRKLHVNGNYAYVTSQSGNSLLIVDISDPTTPTLTGSITDATNLLFPQCISVIGRYAYVGMLSNRIAIIDVSDPTTPTIVGNLLDDTDLNTPFSIQVTGNYAYVSCTSGSSITVVDISSPAAPFVVTSFSDSTNISQPRGMFVSGKYAYTANFASTSFSVVDLRGTDISTANIGAIETSDLSVTNNAIINNNLYASGLNVGLRGIHSDGDMSTSLGTVSVLGGDVIEVFTEDDLGTVTAGVNIVPASNTTYILMAPITQTLPIDITTGTTVQYLTTNRSLNTLTYTNTTDAQFRGTDITALYFFDLVLKGSGTGTLFDINGGFISCKFPDFENYSDLGTVQNLSDFFCPGTFFEIIDAGLKFINCTSSTIVDSIIISSGGVDVNAFEVSGVNSGQLQFYDNILDSDAFANFIRIDPNFSSTTHVNVKGNSLVNSSADLFDTTGGSTGTYTAVADNSVSATAVTSVTDNGGIAVFTHAGTSPFLGSTVTVSGFSETTYNVTGVVSLTTATTFEIQVSGVDVAFVATDTGSYLMNGITLTSTAHGLSFGNSLTLNSDSSTEYDGGGTIYNIQTNSFDFAETFGATQTGSWDTSGIDQNDNRVLSSDNPGFPDSKTQAFGFINGNTVATSITDGTYVAVDITGFSSESDITERFTLSLSDNGVWELTATADFAGFLFASSTTVKSGSSQSYKFAMGINGVAPDFSTANHIPVTVKTDEINTGLIFSVSIPKGDTVQIFCAGNGTGDNITVTDLVMAILQ